MKSKRLQHSLVIRNHYGDSDKLYILFIMLEYDVDRFGHID